MTHCTGVMDKVQRVVSKLFKDAMHAQALGDATEKAEKALSRQHAKAAKSYAAGALVQAALNAMAVSAPGSEPSLATADFLVPASPVAAVIAVQVCLRLTHLEVHLVCSSLTTCIC